MTVRWRLRLLLAATVVPLVLLLAFHAYSGWRTLAGEGERAALNEARSLAARLGALLDGARQATTAIALRVQDEGFDLTACTSYLASVTAADARYFSAAVVTPEGRVWCRSHPGGPAILPQAHRDHLAAAVRSAGPVLGDVGLDPVRGTPSLPLALAYRDGAGQVLGVALLAFDLDRLAALMAEHVLPDQGFAAVVDRQGAIALHVPDDPPRRGGTLLAAPTSEPASAASAVLPALEHDGRAYIAARVPVEAAAAAVTVVVGLERAAALAPARAALFLDLGVAGLATALALLAGWLMAGRLIERPIRGFVETAQRRAAGDFAARFPSDVKDGEFGRLGAALNARAAQFEKLLGEKTQAIREVQHRVMNSLHLLGAILHLHARQVSDEAVRRHLNEARERIVSISVIYRHLYEKDALHAVEFGTVLRGFCAEESDAYLGEHPPIVVEADAVDLPIETSMNLALITHELVASAMTHRVGEAGGALRVELRRDGDRLQLAVIDPHSGLSAEQSRSLGMMIVQSLTRQLRGRFAVERRATGTRFAIYLPMPGAPDAHPAPPAKMVA